MLFHCPIHMIVLGMTEGGFLLPELLAALAVDVQSYGKIAIMFPMITSVWEVKECKRACMSVMKELEAEGIPYNKDTELGIMIETPSSVFVAEELAKLVDFFSVGTNDLTQYILLRSRRFCKKAA